MCSVCFGFVYVLYDSNFLSFSFVFGYTELTRTAPTDHNSICAARVVFPKTNRDEKGMASSQTASIGATLSRSVTKLIEFMSVVVARVLVVPQQIRALSSYAFYESVVTILTRTPERTHLVSLYLALSVVLIPALFAVYLSGPIVLLAVSAFAVRISISNLGTFVCRVPLRCKSVVF